jgi:hypothetical protein
VTVAPAVAHQRILRGVAATLAAQFVDYEGEPAEGTEPVTLDVSKADGTAVVTAASATDDAATGVYTYQLAAANNTTLELLTAVWKDNGTERLRTLIEVVGGFYFSIVDLESFDSSLPNLDATAASTAKARRVRAEVERECELITGKAFVPRYHRLYVDGNGRDRLLLPGVLRPRTVRSVRVYTTATDYTAFTSAELAAVVCEEHGEIVRTDGAVWPVGTQNLVIEVEHGYDRPPEDLRHAAMTRFRSLYNAEATGIPDRATSFTISDVGVFSLATPGRAGFETGIPEVDAVYGRYTVKRIGLA